MKKANRQEGRQRRQKRVRKKVSGVAERPRLSVFRSNRHIYAQVIDDTAGTTLAFASSMEKGLQLDGKDKSEKAAEVGRLIASRAREKGIEKVVFERGGNLYHGRVKALAEGAREGGLIF
ncbi:MAG: 50S ribosomal protein L18 [Actinobacteria bacterium RBG_19FT_COMBO_54_7]|uniref:Large ribosomal subunit protein uL18 n=1 Tax=Candidatus Solincola sediminis TaxID=1797199 RepID=A0A1F2WHY3_9ACTN|nr:MAG: 50S ribosomal protein L18 [Candidatus Solincola sediminis]OFW59820.1 MAG: 50S ribosomal protein L18 [Candidatus Solincola sediminis]OFW65160.1 MAG: 50S ribosomal protein L18 [Actinobacteria bacterium RBG_19FT_COMBO_54_7]